LSYNSYHTNLILLHNYDALPIDHKCSIPNSTLSNWKKKDISKIIGCDSISGNDVLLLKEIAKSKRLLLAAKALYFLFQTVSNLFKYAENKAELLRLNKTVILDTIRKVQPVLGTKRILRSLGLSHSKMYYWIEKKKCENSFIQLCQSRHPNQLRPGEVNTIKSYLLDDRFKNWSSLSIYYQAIREKAVFMGIGTWYKYTNRLGINHKFFRLNLKRKIGIRASRPLQILHMDITIFKPLDHTKVYIYFIIDNFSRAILNWKASLEYSSAIALTLLKEAIQKHNIELNTSIITDGGSENKGELSKFIEGNEKITKLIAQKDIIQSNSMIESVNKHVKYYYLFKKVLKDFAETINYLSHSIVEYNSKPHGKLYGLTPDEVLNGQKPNREIFRNDIAKARKSRLIQNQSIQCCESK
jgi:hypothetical protein